MCSFFKWVRILPELHKMSAKLVDFCGVVPQELIGAMCWPTVWGVQNWAKVDYVIYACSLAGIKYQVVNIRLGVSG